jgi:Resolvase, N terminal domain
MPETLIGYARCSTDDQDLTAQRDRLRELGVTEKRIYLNHGLTGTNRARPGLDQALAAVREGDTLVVPKLDRLARSVPDARAIGDDLAARGIKLSLGGQVYDRADPMGKMFWPAASSRRSSSSATKRSAPSSMTSGRALLRPVPITSAPAQRASWTAADPTAPPAPWTTTVCPAASLSWSNRACHAVRPARGTAAACTSRVTG